MNTSAKSEHTGNSGFKKEVLEWVKILLAAAAIAFVLNTFVIANSYIPSGSMENTIMTGDRIIGSRLSYAFGAQPQRGDIVLFDHKAEPGKDKTRLVKRIIGLPGETVDIRDNQIYINQSDTPLDEPYLPEPMDSENYHFQVLSILLDKLGFEFGKGLVHFSYGMVELPEGKMKSREGTVVDADDLMEEMIGTAHEISQELGKLDEMTPEEAANISRIVGLGSLKYFILKVDPRKNMTFNPKESIDFNGNTGPFIQYTYARIRSVLRKAAEQGIVLPKQLPANTPISEKEEGLVQMIADYAVTVKEAGKEYSPAYIANYIYDLVKEYNQFYHDFSILREENPEIKQFRLVLSENVAKVVKSGMSLLGIEVPERM